MKMTELTEKEYDELDDAITAEMPPLKKGVGGVFTRQSELLSALDVVSANYIRTKAEATNRLPSQIIGDMVRKELASA
jgi:hypothetical protein